MVIKKILFFFLIVPVISVRCLEWELTQLIWNFGLIASCDVGIPHSPRIYFQKDPVLDFENYKDIKARDIVWVPSSLVLEFYQKIFPQIRCPFVLVISDGDASFPSDCLRLDLAEELLADEKIIHVFAQNCDYQGTSNKISPIPIGIDFHTVAYKGMNGGWGMIGSPLQQEHNLLNHLKRAPPTSQRKCRAFVDFQHSDTMRGDFRRDLQFGEDRTSIFKAIVPSGVVDFGKWMNRGDLWKTKREYAFSISPHGNGIDCHRTWEDLALGCIVIVKSSILDPIYEGLPVVIINDWTEINEKNFKKWILQYGDASCNPSYRERLTCRYWIEKIIKMAERKSYD